MKSFIPTINAHRTQVMSRLIDSKRKELGQFMTPPAIAEFMASLFTYDQNIHFLDAGAGMGSLTSAFLDKAILKKNSINIEAWEINPTLCDYLKRAIKHYSQQKGGELISPKVHTSDFIEDSYESLISEEKLKFTHVLLNPPYKKISSNSRHRALLNSVGIKTVNMYSAFIALAILQMKIGGELVAIVPRSFCNGKYYKPFRELLLNTCSINRIHLFESRSKAFKEDEVLQENVIIHLSKGVPQGEITVSTSHDAQFLDYLEKRYNFSVIVKENDPEYFIHIPSAGESGIMPLICTHTLEDLGINVSTGPVVDFRLKQFWGKNSKEDIPLIYPQHFKGGNLVWPEVINNKPNALIDTPEIRRLSMSRGNYVLVKRFSTKEENRRIVAYYLDAKYINNQRIGFENHLNVFHIGKNGLDEDMARGLMVFLNSTLIDKYFRTFSGHTQVNVTDLRFIKYPSPGELRALGVAIKNKYIDQDTIDNLINLIPLSNDN